MKLANDAGEAFNLAKAAGSKITNGIIEAGSKLIPQKRDDPPQQDWRQGADQDPYDSLFRRRDSAYGRRGGLARSDPVNDLFSSIFKGLGKISISIHFVPQSVDQFSAYDSPIKASRHA